MASSDLRLLAALFDAPFASYAELGRRIRVTGEGARRRLLRLEEQGVLRGFVAVPVPSIFDRVGAFVTVEAEAVDTGRALGLPDVVLAGGTMGGLFTVVGFVPRGRQDARRSVWRDALGTGEARYEGAYRTDVDPDPLGPLAWRVLRALLTDPRAPLVDVAEATGLTPRTVRDRRDELVASGALEVTPLLGPSDAGRLFLHVAVVGAEESAAALAARLPDAVPTGRMAPSLQGTPRRAAILFCEAASLPALQALLDDLQDRPGVEEVLPYLLEDYAVHTARLERWIDEALERWEAARGSPGDR